MKLNLAGRAAWLGALALSAACAPVVTHGPRVDPGVGLVLTAGTPRPLCDTGCTADLIPMFGAGVRYGWVPEDPAQPAVMISLSAPVFDVTATQLDLYLEGPGRGGDWAYGIGGMVSPTHVTPYAQVGHQREGQGPYATAAYVWITDDPNWDWAVEDDASDFAELPRYWMPQLGYRLRGGRGPMDFYLAGAFGRYAEKEYVFDEQNPEGREIAVRRPLRMLMAGVTITASLERFGQR